ncbi:hypothetical protein YTCETSXE_CDS0032 [Staphylococcus phage MVC_VPHSA2]|uniref:Uncharacterized protein n=1 Tax=Staphylococcus phage MVC_VPHSA1 TaxID=3088876 RepID=A0ABZ0QYT6_9CAUD|nr:hypothetical protein FBHYGVHD_CDS0101 [Staphylococcus phage MVC_VPHSA1]WPF64988.1 hypothetical protein YTCETSXE_CDS0032 [Staphylococcus phage MVC_VPHSA2]
MSMRGSLKVAACLVYIWVVGYVLSMAWGA